MWMVIALLSLGVQVPPPSPTPPNTTLTGAESTRQRAAPSQGESGDTAGGTWRPLAASVRRAEGMPVPNAVVSIRRAVTDPEWRSAVADSVGRFQFDSVTFGRYELRVIVPGQPAAVSRFVVIDRNDVGDIVIPTAAQPDPRWVVAVILIYLLSIVVTRWHHIARSVDEMLQRQLSALETRLITEVSVVDERVEALRKRVRELKGEVTLGAPGFNTPVMWGTQPEVHRGESTELSAWYRFMRYWSGPSKRRRFWEFWFWSRGRENAAWMAIHEVERQLAAFLSPDEYVDTYLRWASTQLRLINRADATALADTIVTSLDAPPAADATARASVARGRRALLGRALAVIYEARDTSFSTLMEWHNKASWLMLAALVIIGFLAVTAGGAVLFLAGAAGGFSSRLMRALRREDVPLDYGASWTTLFLSPLFGALAGWFGIALVTFATSSEVNLLGDAFKRVDWYDPTHPITLAIAFMMGFSERLFSAVTSAVELHAERVSDSRTTSAPGAGGTTVPGTPGTPGLPAGAATSAVARLELPTTPTARGTAIAGSVVLATPAAAEVEVNLTTSTPLYALRPPILTIAAGESVGAFEIVGLEGAKAGTVAIKAHLLEVELSGSVEVV